eukprot:GHVR01137886.1.p2 GENE.GHVR01137886.1~~GHVR01137886.1.p2  ORF type:complete len:162 (-),score=25.64 GHVR01137886.1:1817-2302(-)
MKSITFVFLSSSLIAFGNGLMLGKPSPREELTEELAKAGLLEGDESMETQKMDSVVEVADAASKLAAVLESQGNVLELPSGNDAEALELLHLNMKAPLTMEDSSGGKTKVVGEIKKPYFNQLNATSKEVEVQYFLSAMHRLDVVPNTSTCFNFRYSTAGVK